MKFIQLWNSSISPKEKVMDWCVSDSSLIYIEVELDGIKLTCKEVSLPVNGLKIPPGHDLVIQG
jgi:hypothetical protein